MKTLTIRNDICEEIYYTCEVFDGFEVFELARQQWGNRWTTYQVLDGCEILESVINPNAIDTEDIQRIH
jgi:hypothetical protein